VCEPWLICNEQNICVRCGGEDEICCKANEDQEECISGVCTPENICKSKICSIFGICSDCGYPGQPCCEGKEGGVCMGDDICGEDNTCFSCGYINEAACKDNECQGWLVEINGLCNNPFEFNSEADFMKICAQSEPGRFLSQRDQCYWYAAYYQRDETICDLIEWGEMRSLCRDMKFPGFYVVMPY